MGSKLLVKVFKRKDVENTIHFNNEPKIPESSDKEFKAERRSRREIVSTISNWVTERRETNRTEEVEGLRRLLGDSLPTLSSLH